MKLNYEKPEIEVIDLQPMDKITNADMDDDDISGFGSVEEW